MASSERERGVGRAGRRRTWLQQGFFTTKLAMAAGLAENTHTYRVWAGNWVREHRGIYRLTLSPQTEHPDLAIWSLWSRNRDEETECVYSHKTALRLHELSEDLSLRKTGESACRLLSRSKLQFDQRYQALPTSAQLLGRLTAEAG